MDMLDVSGEQVAIVRRATSPGAPCEDNVEQSRDMAWQRKSGAHESRVVREVYFWHKV